MNKISKIIAGLFLSAGMIYLTGCIKENHLDVPTIITPHANLTANMTLAQFAQFYNDSILTPPATAGFGIIKQDIIIKGTVISSDLSGNIYKAIYLEDNTGGLEVAINLKYIYNTYKIGQLVYIKCKDLYLGNYGGLMELGYNNGGAIGQIPANLFSSHLFLDDFPQTPPAPKLKKIPELTNADLCTMVTIDSLHFTPAGVTYGYKYGRGMMDNNYHSIVLYSSTYASFANQLTPTGVGSVTGILTSYSGAWQLVINDLSGISGFNSK